MICLRVRVARLLISDESRVDKTNVLSYIILSKRKEAYMDQVLLVAIFVAAILGLALCYAVGGVHLLVIACLMVIPILSLALLY